jgi:SulP family sulfate permease
MRKKLWIEKPSAYGERTTAIFPSLDLFRHYRREWFMGDMTAGLLIFATTIPAALAYGELAGLKHVNGLYASLLAMVVYALVGTSRQLIVDAEAAVAILVATSVASVYAGGDPVRFAAFAFLEAIMVGAMQALAGVCRVGFAADFIPKSVVAGFINGMALIIILAQVGKITGIELKTEAFFPRIYELISRIHEAHHLTLYVGGACLLGMLILRPLLRRIPEAVVMVVLATVAAVHWDLGAQGIHLVGKVPAGLPHPLLPNVGLQDIFTMFPVALGVALVSYLDTTITGRSFATRGGYHLDPNQELIALGLTNIGCGFFQGFAIGSSHSRTAINEMSGGRSQLAGLLAAILLGVFLLYGTSIVNNVPVVALSAIIILAGINLLRPRELLAILRTRAASGYISMITTLSVLLAGLMIGVLVSVALAIALVLHRLARPHQTITMTPKLPGLLIYRFAGPLYFFNAAYFAHRVQTVIESASKPVTTFLINAEAIVDIDFDAIETLIELDSTLKRQGIFTGICEVKGHFKKLLMDTRLPQRANFVIYPSIAEAVKELSKGQSKVAEAIKELDKEQAKVDAAVKELSKRQSKVDEAFKELRKGQSEEEEKTSKEKTSPKDAKELSQEPSQEKEKTAKGKPSLKDAKELSKGQSKKKEETSKKRPSAKDTKGAKDA